MGSVSEKADKELFETILCSPGMSEKVKINLNLSRQQLLLLSRLIETGLLSEKTKSDDPILEAMSAESAGQWKEIYEDLLVKAGLKDFYERIKKLA